MKEDQRTKRTIRAPRDEIVLETPLQPESRIEEGLKDFER